MSTAIQWTDETWNPIVGCSHVSSGCKNCYAERMDRRQMMPGRKDGFRPWTAQNVEYNVRLHPERLGQPLKWKKPRKVFVCSMSDLFHERVPDVFISSVLVAIALAPQHIFQVLTKRRRMVEYFNSHRWSSIKNLWLGISAEDQKTFDERVRWLQKTPAAVKFVSLEPLLGDIHTGHALTTCSCRDPKCLYGPKLDWVIVGGESGPCARPTHPGWVRRIRNDCLRANVPFFFKQWGEWLQRIPKAGEDLGGDARRGNTTIMELDREPDGHFRRGDVWVKRVGKKAAGRELDGRTWDEFPQGELNDDQTREN